jgi:flavorubredoxin
MPVVNAESGTQIDEIADGIFRISTPVRPTADNPLGFSFNQYLVASDQPLLYHTGLRRLFPLTASAIETVTPVRGLRYIAFSHVEADECGALNDFLAAAPDAVPLCGAIAAMVSIGDIADRAPNVIEDGETLSLGRHSVTWLATPHLPHAWECGHMFEETTKTLFCGDLFTQGGADLQPVTEADILEPSEAFRRPLDYYSHTRDGALLIEKLAAKNPRVLACMHGSAWRGDGASLLRALGRRLTN